MTVLSLFKTVFIFLSINPMMFAACPLAADFKASSPEALLQKTDKTGTQIWPPIPAMNLGTR